MLQFGGLQFQESEVIRRTSCQEQVIRLSLSYFVFYTNYDNSSYSFARSFAELAKAAGSPKAARATGQAMRNNPAAIITPCHRVIASSGKLHGFSGKTDPKCKELKTKQYLLSLERNTLRSL